MTPSITRRNRGRSSPMVIARCFVVARCKPRFHARMRRGLTMRYRDVRTVTSKPRFKRISWKHEPGRAVSIKLSSRRPMSTSFMPVFSRDNARAHHFPLTMTKRRLIKLAKSTIHAECSTMMGNSQLHWQEARCHYSSATSMILIALRRFDKY